MLMGESFFGIGPGRWIALRLSQSGEIEGKVVHPGYSNGIAMAYLPASDRLLVTSEHHTAILSALDGEILHQVHSPESTFPIGVFPAADESRAILFNLESAQLWQLPGS